MAAHIHWTDETIVPVDYSENLYGFRDYGTGSLKPFNDWQDFNEAEMLNDLPVSNTSTVNEKTGLENLTESIVSSDWFLPYLDEAIMSEDFQEPFIQENNTSYQLHITSTPTHNPNDVRGFSTTNVITDRSLVAVSPFPPNLGETFEEELEDLDLDIQILLGINSSSGCQPSLPEISYSPPLPITPSPSADANKKNCLPGKDTYRCPEESCGKSYARRNALNRHINSIHRRPGILCPFCSGKKVFNRSDNFRSTEYGTAIVEDEKKPEILSVLQVKSDNGVRLS
ncbi:hypothetical protein BZA77DRAFT_295448 [Pyronema omphalodes]|nr:hypothetical protein BZA77DRAFT_295448 [Pyronema omphalodes]